MGSLENVKVGSNPESIFVASEIPEQKRFGNEVFPLVFTPGGEYCCGNLAEAIRAHKPWLEARLQEAGALLFRGFGVPTASDFSGVFEAFGYPDAPFIASGAPRVHVVGRIFTANDGPSHMTFYSHNEMAYIKDHPLKAFFYCEVEPESGGETPIVLGHVLYQRMMDKHPQFVERLEKHGLLYCRGMANGNDPDSMIGRGWQTTLGTDDKVEAETKAAELGWTLEWKGNEVRAKMPVVPGVKVVSHPDRGERKVWFNSIAGAYMTWCDSRNVRGTGVQFGDGTLLPDDVVLDYLKVIEQERVSFKWKQGDVLMLDNHAVQHARLPFTGSRRVLAAFTM